LVETNIVNLEKKRRSEQRAIRFITTLIILLVTGSIAFSLWFNYQNVVAVTNNNILIKVKAINEADLLYEGFLSDLGDLFALSSVKIPPNPNLPKDKQELIARDGTRLTRLNPTYITRLVHEFASGSDGITRKIVNDDPMFPENQADDWETAALLQIEGGMTNEKMEIVRDERGVAIVRYISPFVVRESCISCHTELKAGERHGGISASLSYAPYFESMKKTMVPIGGVHIAVWILIMMVLSAFSNSIVTQLKKKNMAEDILLDTTAELNKEIALCNEFENELRESRKRFQELAQKDPLTDLSNRRHFFERAITEVKRLQRVGGVLSVAMLDVDHFKVFNDNYGHIAGDNCLRAVSAKICEIIREIDIVARYGGEEFILLFPQTSAEHALTVTERLRSELAALPIDFENEQDLYITVSLGFTEVDTDNIKDVHPEEVIHNAIHEADLALYYAKRTRNTVSDFHQIPPSELNDPALNESVAELEMSVEFKDPTNNKDTVQMPKYAEDLQKAALQPPAVSESSFEQSDEQGIYIDGEAMPMYSAIQTDAPLEDAPQIAEEQIDAEITAYLQAPINLAEQPDVDAVLPEAQTSVEETVSVEPAEDLPEEISVEVADAEQSSDVVTDAPTHPASGDEAIPVAETAQAATEQKSPPPIEPISPEGFVLEEDDVPFNKKT
jgi:diguanylate cyclase (GGDEF)-like protein